MSRRCTVSSTLAAVFLLLNGPLARAEAPPHLTVDLARKLIAACTAKSVEKGWKMTIAVVDSGSNLIAFERMDRSFLGSTDIALNKARTSAKFPFPSRVIEDLAYGKNGKPPGLPGIALVPGLVAFAGGMPVLAGGQHIGAIGVSGGTADEDEVCAQAALDAVKSQLAGT